MKRCTFALVVSALALCAACSSGVNESVNARLNASRAAGPSRSTQSGAASWPVWGFDSSRSGFNSAEQTLTVANVGGLQLQWQISLGHSPVDSAPIYVAGAGPSQQSMLFMTSKIGITYGIDASNGQILWKFVTTARQAATTSAPAADPSGQWIYAPGIDGKVHKLGAATGAEVPSGGFPALISVMPVTERDESPLNVANGYLFATVGGAGNDRPPYDGHVVSINLSDGQSTVFNSLCSEYHEILGPSGCTEQRSGIWARGGAVVDPDPSMNGRIYVATGNGDFNANVGGYDYGDSVISLAPDLSSIVGTYTPANYQQLDQRNDDLGTTAPAMLPAQPASSTPLMLAQGGKDGILRLVNRAALPGIGGELQTIHLPRSIYSAPAVWTDSSNNAWLFVGLLNSVNAYRLNTKASGVSRLALRWSASPGHSERGTSPVVADGIVFVAFGGALVALDALTGNELWSSASPGVGGTIGGIHFQSPIVVNGWVYCTDHDGKLSAYALPGSRTRRR